MHIVDWGKTKNKSADRAKVGFVRPDDAQRLIESDWFFNFPLFSLLHCGIEDFLTLFLLLSPSKRSGCSSLILIYLLKSVFTLSIPLIGK